MKNWSLLIFVLATLLMSCMVDLKEPEFKNIENIKLNKMSLDGADITLGLRYFNPNKGSGVLKEANGEAWIDSSYLGSFMMDTAVSIGGQSDFVVPVSIKVDLSKLMKYSIGSLTRDSFDLRISGNAKASKAGISKNFPLNYKGRQSIKGLLR